MLPIWLLPLALAADPAEGDDGLAAAIGVRVDMSATFVRGGVIARDVWGKVPDPSAVELALAQHAVAVEDAAVIEVVTRSKDGETVGARIDWIDLAEGSVQPMAEGRGKRVCTPSSRGGLWNGGDEIRVFAATDDAHGRVRDVPAMVMVEDHPRIGALVSLTPGDVVTVRDVRRRGVLMRETVTISRPTGDLVMERDELHERVCFERTEP